MPAQPRLFFTQIQKIMSFKVFDAEGIVSYFLTFTLIEDEPISQTLDDMDYGSQI